MSTPGLQNNKPRIAILLPRLSRYGGVEGFAWRLARRLAREGFDVDFICARRETQPPDGVHPIIVGRYGLLRVFKIAWFALMAERIRRANNYALSIGLGMTLRQDILRIGGGPLPVFWKLSKQAYPKGPARAWKMLRRRLAPANWMIRFIETRQIKNARQIVAVSDLVEDWLKKGHAPFDAEKIQVIYNKPDLDKFRPPRGEERNAIRTGWGVSLHEKVIGVAGTNFMLKGVRPLLGALALLPTEYTLVVAGGRNPGKFLQHAKTLGVETRVRFLGRVDDMPAFYHGCDVFALPSYYDACANAVLEALACGVPTVSSAQNGSSCFLPPSHVIDSPDNTPALARAIREAAQHTDNANFSWPKDAPCGLTPYVDMVRRMLVT